MCVLLSPLAAYVANKAGLSLVSLRLLPQAAADHEVGSPLVPAIASKVASPRLSRDPHPSPDQPSVGAGEGHGMMAWIARIRESALSTRPALTLTLSQGERGPDRLTLSQKERGRSLPVSWHGRSIRGARLLGAVTLLWAIGSLFLLSRLLHGWWSIAGLQRRLQPVPGDRLRAVLAEVRRGLNVEALPRLAISPAKIELAGPITIGLLRPLVVLPEQLLETLDIRGLRDVLLHEFAHALRRDPLVGLLQRVAAASSGPIRPSIW